MQACRRAGVQACRRAGGQAGRRAGGQAGRRAGGGQEAGRKRAARGQEAGRQAGGLAYGQEDPQSIKMLLPFLEQWNANCRFEP